MPIPQPCVEIVGYRDDAVSIRTEKGGIEPMLMAAKNGHEFACGRIPQPGGVVLGCGQYARSIRAEGGGDDRIHMSTQYEPFFLGGDLPDSCGKVIRDGDEQLSIGTEDGGSDIPVLATQGTQYLVCIRIPQPGFILTGAGQDKRTVTAEGDKLHPFVMTR